MEYGKQETSVAPLWPVASVYHTCGSSNLKALPHKRGKVLHTQGRNKNTQTHAGVHALAHVRLYGCGDAAYRGHVSLVALGSLHEGGTIHPGSALRGASTPLRGQEAAGHGPVAQVGNLLPDLCQGGLMFGSQYLTLAAQLQGKGGLLFCLLPLCCRRRALCRRLWGRRCRWGAVRVPAACEAWTGTLWDGYGWKGVSHGVPSVPIMVRRHQGLHAAPAIVVQGRCSQPQGLHG